MLLISGLLNFTLLVPSRGVDAQIVSFALLYGLFAGGFLSLLPTYLANVIPQPVFGSRMGVIYAFIAVASLAGTPTAGMLVQGGQESNFRSAFGFAGIMVTLGGLFGAATWALEAKKVFRNSSKKEELTWRSFCF
jgi:MCP family monocarboxylic acid transporter-like MFS transporter 10